jgi:glycosyltransferase involved in cell wall biosynthesis
LTWGLLGPGKGIEWVIDAMASLKDLPNPPRYVIAGRTHPKVLAAQGERYRDALVAQSKRLAVADLVSFDAVYRTPEELTALIQTATVVVLPYDSKDQVTSGVLVDSLASGRPIIATAFPHAVELLAGGAGTVVAHGDPDALAAALRQLLTDPDIADSMAAQARGMAPTIAWPVVVGAYLGAAQRLLASHAATA